MITEKMRIKVMDKLHEIEENERENFDIAP